MRKVTIAIVLAVALLAGPSLVQANPPIVRYAPNTSFGSGFYPSYNYNAGPSGYRSWNNYGVVASPFGYTYSSNYGNYYNPYVLTAPLHPRYPYPLGSGYSYSSGVTVSPFFYQSYGYGYGY